MGGTVDERGTRIDDLNGGTIGKVEAVVVGTYGVDNPCINERVVHRDASHAKRPKSLDDTCISRCGRREINDSNTCETTGTQDMVSSLAFDTSIPPK